jgi:chromosome segregation ATPase
MRSLFRRLLGTLGLVRQSQLVALQQRLDKVMERAARLHDEVEALKRQLKVAAGEAARQGAKLTQERAAFRAELAETRDRIEREKQHARKLEERSAKLEERARELKPRLEQALKSVQLAQEHLMTTEVKLDIVEGAVNVLDERTRQVSAEATTPERVQA